MRSFSMLTMYFIALLCVLQILQTVDCAPFEVETHADNEVASRRNFNDEKEVFSFRQASDDDSAEDSDEDDGEYDAEQAHQNFIEQQQQQNLEESQEGSQEDEEDDRDDADNEARHFRQRRDVEQSESALQQQMPAMENKPVPVIDKEQQTTEVTSVVMPAVQLNTEETSATSTLNRTSVLILIRDALKKVTTVLPTEQVATNALQYFQLFEHFIQQTIERVIDDYDEDEEETTTAISNNNEVPESEINSNHDTDTKQTISSAQNEENKVEETSAAVGENSKTSLDPNLEKVQNPIVDSVLET